MAWKNTPTFVVFGKVVCHLPILIAVQDAVGDVQVICCHLVDALGNADERRCVALVRTLLEVFRGK